VSERRPGWVTGHLNVVKKLVNKAISEQYPDLFNIDYLEAMFESEFPSVAIMKIFQAI
jgi:hypothetical protein